MSDANMLEKTNYKYVALGYMILHHNVSCHNLQHVLKENHNLIPVLRFISQLQIPKT